MEFHYRKIEIKLKLLQDNVRAGARHAATAEETPPSIQEM
ncbi:MAG: hypothetical protein YK1312THETA_1200002 [Marine Group I thaumarchaeote]|nr:MAG: hypothetical protein YK1312THETA_1200002 [Marine Group I thaumarchaeote]